MAVVLRGSKGPAAIDVRHIRGVEDIIAHPVPELAGTLPFIGGFSVDAAGRPRPVLAPDALAAAANP